MLTRLVWTSAACALAIVARAGAQAPLTRQDADSLERKLAAIVERSAREDATPSPLRTELTDRELNAYFKFQGAAQLPAGVRALTFGFAGGGRLVTDALVDLDAIRSSRERAWSDPLAYVSGSVTLHATAWLRGANGKGTLVLESATLSGVTIPKALVQEIVNYATRTPEQPGGFAFDQPFDLPNRIRQVELQRGSAVIVQ